MLSSTDINKGHYNHIYANDINYKYKTNTRYQRYLVECIENYIEDPNNIKSLLDIGCGQGLNTVLFAKDFPKADIVGIDLSDVGIEYAHNRWGGVYDSVRFECGNVMDKDYSKEKYDIVTAFELLEHIEDWKPIAKTMCKVAQKYIIVSAPIGKMRAYETYHGHYRNYQIGELEEFFEGHGFRTLKTYYAGFPFWSPITRNLLNILPGDSTAAQDHLTIFNKLISLMLYYLYRYCSTKNKRGDQFMGLFQKI